MGKRRPGGSTIAVMKKTMTALVFAFVLSPLGALSLSAGIDAASLLSFAYGTTGVSGEAAVQIDGHLRTTLGIGWYSTGDYSDDVRLVNLALGADYFPFEDRDLVSASASDAYYLSSRIGQLGRISFTCLVSFRYDFASTSQEEMQ